MHRLPKFQKECGNGTGAPKNVMMSLKSSVRLRTSDPGTLPGACSRFSIQLDQFAIEFRTPMAETSEASTLYPGLTTPEGGLELFDGREPRVKRYTTWFSCRRGSLSLAIHTQDGHATLEPAAPATNLATAREHTQDGHATLEPAAPASADQELCAPGITLPASALIDHSRSCSRRHSCAGRHP